MSPAFYKLCQIFLYIFFRSFNRYTIVGQENLPSSGGYILASNHVSYLDPPVLGSRIRRPIAFLAKEHLFRAPLLGLMIRKLGAVPVAADSDFRSLREIVRHLKRGELISIFPEGTRSHDGNLLDFKPGVIFLAQMAHVPIIPCFIDGTGRAWPRGSKIMRPAKITVRLGAPYKPGPTSEDKETFYQNSTRDLMQKIESLGRTA